MAAEGARTTRDGFLRGTARFAAAGTGMGLLVPSALARGKVKKGGVLRFAYGESAAGDTTDPSSSISGGSYPAFGGTYDRLTFVVPNTWQVLPRLALSWTATADAKTWTFKLRKGVKFHNGKTLDSKDVAWSYRRILDKKNGSSAYARLSGVLDPSGIKTPNSTTVVFHLKKPDAQFPGFTGLFQSAIVPNGVDPKKTPIGTGAFMIKSFKATQGWQLVRNPNYWNAPYPYLDGVQAVYIPDPITRALSIANGTSELSDWIPFAQAAQLRKNPKLRLLTLPGAFSPNYAFDYTQEPFTDPRVAQAIKIAVDRNVLNQAATLGTGTVTGDVPELPLSPFYPPQRGVPKQNIADAKALLKAAGHSDGLQFTLTISGIFAGAVEMATALKQVVAPAGIDITLETVPSDTFYSDSWLKKPAFVSFWLHRHPREILDLAFRSNAPWNESKFKSPALDRLIDAGAATPSLAKQRALFRQALYIVATQSGVGFPLFESGLAIAKKRVNGVRMDQQSRLLLETAWLA
jgi:peptide/nickel transport system substrate-binding protein